MMSSNIQEAFKTLSIDIQTLPDEEFSNDDAWLAKIQALAPSGFLLHTLLLAAFTHEIDEAKRYRLAARAHHVISTRRTRAVVPEEVDGPTITTPCHALLTSLLGTDSQSHL